MFPLERKSFAHIFLKRLIKPYSHLQKPKKSKNFFILPFPFPLYPLCLFHTNNYNNILWRNKIYPLGAKSKDIRKKKNTPKENRRFFPRLSLTLSFLFSSRLGKKNRNFKKKFTFIKKACKKRKSEPVNFWRQTNKSRINKGNHLP